jgi:hypothetical protein
MNTRRLYGQRRRPAPNLQAITDYFWALCQKYGTADVPEVQESYILAQLLPFARSNAGRRVFADGHLRAPERFGDSRAKMEEELEGLLRSSCKNRMAMVNFKNRTADVLGPPIVNDEIRQSYLELANDFLADSRAALVRNGDKGVQAAIDHWQQITRQVGRRAGHATEKQVLNILSYECRAAFHRCYSAVWTDLIPRLTLIHELSPASQHFLHFWHLDHCSESAEGPHALFHLFHGHIFALHPVGAALMQTSTGRKLLGAWLQDPESELAFGQLLHAILITVYHYAGLRETAASNRRKQSIPHSDDAMPYLEDKAVGKRKRRRQVRIR